MSSPSPQESMELAQRPPTLLDSPAAHQEDSLGPQQEETIGVPLDSWCMPGTTSKSDSSTHELVLPHPGPSSRHFWERLGKPGLFILIIGTLLLLGCLGNLLFLWFGADRASRNVDPGPLWQMIASSGWITRTVTISSAAMRAVITMQAAVVTSMVSALFLESANTELFHLPLLSITRAVRLSPVSLIQPQLLGRKSLFKATYSLIILFSSILVVVSQFLSTILISDFASVRIAGPENSTNIHLADRIHYSTDHWYGIDDRNFCGTAPSAFWRFAEYHEDPEREEDPERTGYVDTGVTIRAAIPWADASSRLGLMRYSGPARLWDARVLCISPTLHNVTVQTFQGQPRVVGTDQYGRRLGIPLDRPFINAADPSPPTISPTPTLTLRNVTTRTPAPEPTAITGYFSYHDSHPALKPSGGNNNGSFFSCLLRPIARATICSFSPKLGIQLQSQLPSIIERNGTFGVMVFKLNPPEKYEGHPFSGFNKNQSTEGWLLLRRGPWTTAVNRSNYELFSASTCFTIPFTFSGNVTFSGAAAESEPKMSWSQNPTGSGWSSGSTNTFEVRRQLGVAPDKNTLNSRGILALDPSQVFSGLISDFTTAGLYGIYRNKKAIGLTEDYAGKDDDTDNPYFKAHDVHASLFLDILNTTNNPSYAIQALSTTLYQMQHFDSSYKWMYSYPVSYVMSQEISIPVQKIGLHIVVGIVAVHIVLVGTTVTVFLRRTRATLLGNVWQSVAQVISDRTTDILWRADSMTDKEVKVALSSTEYDPGNKSTGVIRRRQNGRNEFGSLAD